METTTELTPLDTWMTYTGEELPKEASQLPANRVAELAQRFVPYMQIVKGLREEAMQIEVTDEDDAEGMNTARRLRIEIKNARVEAEKIRKEEKQFSLITGRTVDFFGKAVRELAEMTEEHLRLQETFAERMEQARRDELRQKREQEIYAYALEGTRIEHLDTMTEDEYQHLLQDMKDAAAYREQRAAQEAAEREAAMKAEQEERERLRAENERLRAEQEEQARQAREAAEKAAQADLEMKESARIDSEKAASYELWKFFQEEHGLTLTETDLNEIIARVKEYFLAVKAAKQ